MQGYIQKAKKDLKHFFLIDDTPHKVAAGFALGIFLGIMPGEGVGATLIVAYFLRFNRLSAIAGVLASNMWMTVVALPIAATVGGFIFGISPESLVSRFWETYGLGWKYFFTEMIFFEILTPFFVGFFIVSLLISLSSYSLIYFILKYKKLKFK